MVAHFGDLNSMRWWPAKGWQWEELIYFDDFGRFRTNGFLLVQVWLKHIFASEVILCHIDFF